jgi:hypothetical protein
MLPLWVCLIKSLIERLGRVLRGHQTKEVIKMMTIRNRRVNKMWLVDEIECYDIESVVETILENGNGYRLRRQSIFRESSSGIEDMEIRVGSMTDGDTIEISGMTVECFDV